MPKQSALKYWSMPSNDVLRELHSASEGLTAKEAGLRLKEYGKNSISPRRTAPLMLFINQFKNPIILIMIIATAISALPGDWLDGKPSTMAITPKTANRNGK